MIRLDRRLVEGIEQPRKLHEALQHAVMLEHATIPPYLYALYSIQRGANADVSAILRSVVLEEMKHMALACNILNAVGGAPRIDGPKFLPTYPGHLPGGVDSTLVVHLAPLSVDLVRDEFMSIEEPEKPIEFRTGDAEVEVDSVTIGEFYAQIRKAIVDAGDDIFTGPHSRQVTHEIGDEKLEGVYDVTTAVDAIDFIVEQGEGTTTSPLDEEGDLAHYYRFEEIVKGARLVADPSAPNGYSYSGAPITLDPAGILPVVTDPAPYPEGSVARHLDDSFNYTYTAMLRSLHDTFNGHPDRLGAAVGLMESCKQQALALMQVDLGDGTVAGPAFRFQPTNP